MRGSNSRVGVMVASAEGAIFGWVWLGGGLGWVGSELTSSVERTWLRQSWIQ